MNSDDPLNSSGKSAFDVLMAGARGAAAKLKHQQSSKKRKDNSVSPVSKLPKTPGTYFEKVQNNEDDDQSSINKENPLSTEISSTSNDVMINNKISMLRTKAAADFDPESVAFWANDETIPFSFLSRVFDMMSEEPSKNVCMRIACNMLRTVMQTTPGDLLAVLYISANKISSKYELGVGETCVVQALVEAFGTSRERIKEQKQQSGNLGIVAENIRSSQPVVCKPKPLTVTKVFETLQLIAKESGKNSKEKKRIWIKRLMVSASGSEPKYIVSLLLPKESLRIRFSETSWLEALGQAAVSVDNHSRPPKLIQSPLQEAAKIVRQAHVVCPCYEKIVSAILSDGVSNLPRTCCFVVGVPVEPMGAKSTTTLSEVFERFDGVEYTCEYKYDGESAQVTILEFTARIENGDVEIFSRNLERTTSKFPDVVTSVSRLKKPSVKSFVLDCEIVAYDQEKQEILPFQILSTRGRKNVDLKDIKVKICIFAFDMLYLNGEPLIQEQLKVRRKHLYESFNEEPGILQFAAALISSNIKEIENFLDAAINARIGDTLDLVPIAAYNGSGNRTGVYGAFLLACYDDDEEVYQSICNIGTGIPLRMLEEIFARLEVIPGPKPCYQYVADKVSPDVWFEASEVWEVKAQCLTISPCYSAAIGLIDDTKGLSLRSPSLERIRLDKNPDQASSSMQIAEMYRTQIRKKPGKQPNDGDEETRPH